MAGGGIYSSPLNYSLVLRSLLNPNSSPLLSPASIDSLFTPSIEVTQARADLAAMLSARASDEPLEAGDVDWSTGMCVWKKRKMGKDGKAWGRSEDSAGWMGAGNTEVWVDRKAGIAVSPSSPSPLPLSHARPLFSEC